MDECIEILSDSDNCENTIIVDPEVFVKVYNNEDSKLARSIKETRNIYNLDNLSDEDSNYIPIKNKISEQTENVSFKKDSKGAFSSLFSEKAAEKLCDSDEEFAYVSFENRVNTTKHKSTANESNISWHDKYSREDFCDDSNDLDIILNRINELKSEQPQDELETSKEFAALITGDIIEQPKKKPLETPFENIYKKGKNVYHCSVSSDEENFNSFDVQQINKSLKNGTSNSDELLGPKNKRSRKNVAVDKETQMLERKMSKAEKAREREQKKQEKENQKALKNAIRVVENCVKPDQCVKYITVNIDENISNRDYGEVIKAALRSAGYNYKISNQLAPNIISWTRTVPTIENALLQDVSQQEKHYLLIMTTSEFIQHIAGGTFITHIQSFLSLSEVHHLSIAVLGLQKYYKYLKDTINKKFRAAVRAGTTNENSDMDFKNLPLVCKNEVEMWLAELQFLCKNCYFRSVDRYEDLAIFVGECTKAVAQIPYKTAKAETLEQQSQYFNVNNRDCVKVDKDGNGLSRLWNQFLRMFPLASLETAEAVTAVYPTLNSLLEAYKDCQNSQEAERLLCDLPVRRAAGPLGGQRKIGPEFSKKAYKFFCSEENILL